MFLYMCWRDCKTIWPLLVSVLPSFIVRLLFALLRRPLQWETLQSQALACDEPEGKSKRKMFQSGKFSLRWSFFGLETPPAPSRKNHDTLKHETVSTLPKMFLTRRREPNARGWKRTVKV